MQNEKENMKLNLVFLKVEKDLSRTEKKLLNRIIYKHALRAGRLLRISLINIIVHPTKNVIPETGESAFATDDYIKIGLDPMRKKGELKKTITDIIPAAVYHEMHHIARENYYGKSTTLLDAVISEGLADVFAEERWPKFRAPWSQYRLKEVEPFLKTLKKQGKSKNYLHDEWFFGAGKKPKWLGYKLGGYIINSIKKKNPRFSALKMVNMDTKRILKLSGL